MLPSFDSFGSIGRYSSLLPGLPGFGTTCDDDCFISLWGRVLAIRRMAMSHGLSCATDPGRVLRPQMKWPQPALLQAHRTSGTSKRGPEKEGPSRFCRRASAGRAGSLLSRSHVQSEVSSDLLVLAILAVLLLLGMAHAWRGTQVGQVCGLVVPLATCV